ncbi:MAG: von Willebrand factor type A domain-containing protein [Pedobacter sp.]|nr:von Willebrand factor type A domain-containing protein [Pedobacter sp.]
MKILILILTMLLSLTSYTTSKAQERTIKGTVTDKKTGSPIVGVYISVLDDKRILRVKATVNQNGTYSVTVGKDVQELVFSYVSYNTVTIKINKARIIDVKMEETQNALKEEVVIRGYVKRTREATTGSSYIVSGKEVQDVPVGNVEQLLQGVSTGKLKIQNNTGAPSLRSPINIPSLEDNESYAIVTENKFKNVLQSPLSTFSIDVDAASYSNLRRYINNGSFPPSEAIRIEEMVNYFDYEYEQPKGTNPVNINTEISNAPWNTSHRLVKIGLQAKKVSNANLPASNLVFLIDVSGSMNQANKLPLLVSSFKMLADQLRKQDKVAIVVYAGNAGVVLPSTNGNEKTKIKEALNKLSAGGSTAGGEGIELAYKIAAENFVKGGNNRVILATDGDFNVGASSDNDMENLIEQKRKSGIFLTVLGYGMGNYKDSKMEKLADKGNGNYAYIDNISEARKVLITEFGGTLYTVAKDVKLQVEFNPSKAQAYRLIGYENRMLKSKDFNDDKKDAGEMGSGHTVTALYEVIPVGVKSSFSGSVDDLKYQAQESKPVVLQGNGKELMTVKLRYKQPDGNVSRLIEQPVIDNTIGFNQTSNNFRFSAAVAEFGLLLKQSEFMQKSSFDHVISTADAARGKDSEGYRSEFVKLARSAKLLAKELLSIEHTNKSDENY